MADIQLTNQLTEAIDQTLGFKNKSLVSRPEWGAIKFTNAEQDLDRIFSLLGYLSVLPLHYLTDQATNQIKNQIVQTKPPLDQIDKFNIEQPNAPQTRDALISQIHQVADSLYTAAAAWIPFLAYQKGDVAENIEKLSMSVSTANSIVDKAKREIETKTKEIDDIVTKAREASAGAGAAVFTKDFDKEATRLSDNATKWLIAAALLGTATFIIAMLTWFWTQTGLDSGQIWQKVASKFIVLSILLTATLWCGRIYKALMHQSATNRHRALSLQTFQAFSSAASDLQTKDAVLLETTRSIFSQCMTGYMDSTTNSGDSEGRVIEIVKSIVQKPH
jgi:hypothetical protein